MVLGFESRQTNPVYDRFPGLLGNLELYWTLRLLLHDDGTSGDSITVRHVAHPKSDKATGSELAIDADDRIFVLEPVRHRFQVYRRKGSARKRRSIFKRS